MVDFSWNGPVMSDEENQKFNRQVKEMIFSLFLRWEMHFAPKQGSSAGLKKL